MAFWFVALILGCQRAPTEYSSDSDTIVSQTTPEPSAKPAPDTIKPDATAKTPAAKPNDADGAKSAPVSKPDRATAPTQPADPSADVPPAKPASNKDTLPVKTAVKSASGDPQTGRDYPHRADRWPDCAAGRLRQRRRHPPDPRSAQ